MTEAIYHALAQNDMTEIDTVRFKGCCFNNKCLFQASDKFYRLVRNFPGGSEGKASACDAKDTGSIPGSGRSPEEGNGNPLTLAWKIPWMEEPGRLQSTRSQRVGHD